MNSFLINGQRAEHLLSQEVAQTTRFDLAHFASAAGGLKPL